MYNIKGIVLGVYFMGMIFFRFFMNGSFEPIVSEQTVSQELCNPNADENTKKLMAYLTSVYGEKIISGQFCDDKYERNELYAIQRETGKMPAIAGFDFSRYSPSQKEIRENSRAVEWAMEEAADGAIITFCWHWNAPTKYLINDPYNGMRVENTTLDLDKIMNGQDMYGYQELISDMDVVAKELLRLQEKGVPVIWRPLHESSGGWFWWGNCSPESYIGLYRLMYERYTNEWGLNNLIWLWNGQDPEWYPGDDVVDLIGEDIYPDPYDYDPHAEAFKYAQTAYTKADKMVVLSETKPVFDPEEAVRQGAMWGFFCQWSGDSTCRADDKSELSEEFISMDTLKQFYNSPDVITRDELPWAANKAAGAN